MISQQVLDQIQDRCDIVEVIQRVVPLKRAGRNFVAQCPFHSEKSPSFSVSPDKQIFHCFGCGVGGNVFSFLMKYEKLSFPEAARLLAQTAGITIPEDEGLKKREDEREPLYGAMRDAVDFFARMLKSAPQDSEVRAYLTKRRLGEDLVKTFEIGYSPEAWDGLLKSLAPKHSIDVLKQVGLLLERQGGNGHYDRFRNRLMFPIRDLKGRTIGFGGRVLDGSQPKYVNSPETEIYHKGRVLYGMYEGLRAIRDENRVLLVEGYMDVIACHAAGVETAVASSGTALTTDQIRLMKRYTSQVTVLFDADQAGMAATLRGLDLLLEENCRVEIAQLPDGHDPDSYIREFGTDKFIDALGRAETLFDFKFEWLKGQFDARSVEGKVRIAAGMLESIRRIPNEVTKAGYLTELSRRLGLSEDALRVELRKASSLQRTVRVDSAQKVAEKRKIPVSPIEKLLLGLIITEPRLWERGKSQLKQDDFKHEDAKSLLGSVVAADEWNEVQPAKMLTRHQSDEILSRLVRIAVHEAEIVDDKNRAFDDCLARLNAERHRERLSRLKAEIALCEKNNDQERLKTLLKEFETNSRKGKPNGNEVQA